ncbi:uncharacterized protein FYW61_013712 [Anableps anableps]
MATVRHLSSCFILRILVLVVYFNPSLPYVLKNCTIRYQENPTADISLDCANRKIENVPKDIPKDAVAMNLNNNWMKKINKEDFLGMSKLIILDLTSNQIACVDQGSFIDLIFLKTLYIGNNKLNDLISNMFQGLSNLTGLFLNNNGIQVIHRRAFQFLISLQTLDLGNNRLQQITNIQPILQLPQIKMLGLKCNGFSSFETKDLLLNQSSSLKELDISGDLLKVFSITTPIFPYLRRIEFSMCLYYKDLQWDIPEKWLLRNISHLYLERPILSLEGITKVLKSLDSLKHLRLNALKMRVYEGLLSTICKIPTLRKLDLFNCHIDNLPVKLALCSQLTELDMRKSDIGELPQGSLQSMKQLRSLNISDNQLIKVPHDIRSLSSLEIFNLNYNYISGLTCEDFVNTTHLRALYLKRNRISQVDECVFLNLENLKVLDLSFNQLMTFENNLALPKVEILNVNHNDIAFLKMLDFLGFQSLKQLDLGTAFWDGMTQRSSHKVNKLENIIPSHETIWELKHLENLTIEFNPQKPFSSLQSNYSRDIVYLKAMKRFTMICNIFCFPYQLTDILWTMRYLENFTAKKVFIEAPRADMFQFNPYLKSVTFAETDFSDVDPELFLPILNLESLDLSNCNISTLDFLVQANLSALRYLKMTENELFTITETVFNSLPSLTYLDLDNNPFICNCSNAGFIQWVKNNKQTQVVNAHRYKCSLPVDKRESLLLDFDVQSCRDDGGFLYFISSTCLVVLTLLTSFIYHFLRWHLTYTFHLFLAYLYDIQRRKKGEPHQFDAFVSYNVHDEDWVYREMLPVLEGQQGWRLCLHHRDFQPGKPIMENITDAIYGSRKTICVISRHYLQSEWCSREIQMASFRLFDEKKDVLILLFLEEIPSHHLSPYYRIRKLVKKLTYLSWHQAAQNPGVFWQSVHRALQTEDALTENMDLLTGPRGYKPTDFDTVKKFLMTVTPAEKFTAINIYGDPPDGRTFKLTPQLKSLTLVKTDFLTIKHKMFLPIPNLQTLDLSESEIKSLDFLLLANVSALRYLKLTDNDISVVNETVFQSLPSLTYLDLTNNPFTCECLNAGFIQWVKNNKQTQVFSAHQYVCSFPVSKRGTFLLDFDVKSCWDDGSFLYFIFSTCLVVLTLLTSFIYNFLRWHLTYTFHLLRAFLYDTRKRKNVSPHQFDAFVSYNVHDEDWVYREMLPVLEGQQGWRLCLHHRDFQPGKPIIENITDAIYGSRKTICVISRHYLQSEWCSREIQMASFRLFDEQKDVLILLFLEEIPAHHLSPYYRMRKLVKKRTYLSWPQAAQHPGVFWQNVQRALQPGLPAFPSSPPSPNELRSIAIATGCHGRRDTASASEHLPLSCCRKAGREERKARRQQSSLREDGNNLFTQESVASALSIVGVQVVTPTPTNNHRDRHQLCCRRNCCLCRVEDLNCVLIYMIVSLTFKKSLLSKDC